jgi:oxygen-independent coproporphyrinogen-3 oxidase
MAVISQEMGLYIHWPFCHSKCPYCDFNSHVRAAIDEVRWQRALLKELDYVGQETRGRTLVSVFFGGGTPSLMSPGTVGALLDQLSTYWCLAPTIEITLEANPHSVDIQKFTDFRQAGVNRVSLGVQSLRPEALTFLGRLHHREEAIAAVNIARKLFSRFSFDLIYARPAQRLEDWRLELSEALQLMPHHLSLYQLTIEPGTAFYTAYQRGALAMPDEEMSAQFYELTQDIVEAHGLPAYEISNHARPGFECQHNLLYWRYQDYAGIGPGAHGRLTMNQQKYAINNHRSPETWLTTVEAQGHARKEKHPLTADEQLTECLMMGLRLQEGIPLRRLRALTGCHVLTDLFKEDALTTLNQEGYLRNTPEYLQLTAAGLQRLNPIIEFLLRHRQTLSS